MKPITTTQQQWIRFAVNSFLGLLILTIFAGNIGLFTNLFLRFLGLAFFLPLVFINLSFTEMIKQLKQRNREHMRTLIIGVLLLCTFFLLVFSVAERPLWISGLPLGLMGLHLLRKPVSNHPQPFLFLSLTALLYGVFLMFFESIPSLWHATVSISTAWSQIIGGATATSFEVGPSMSGFFVVISFGFAFLSVLFLSRRSLKISIVSLLSFFLLLLVWWSLFLFLIQLFSSDLIDLFVVFELILFLGCFSSFLLICLWFFSRGDRQPSPLFTSLARYRMRTAVISIVLVVFFVSTVSASVFVFDTSVEQQSPSVLFYAQNMVGSWDIPRFGVYGKDGVGMFGLLPVYLNQSGYRCELLVENVSRFKQEFSGDVENISQRMNLSDFVVFREQPLSASVLAEIDVVVLINVNKTLADEQKQVLWEFVENGGSVLVLGDHTNAGGIQKPLNDLLESVAISFDFDSALAFHQDHAWVPLYEAYSHPSMRRDFQVNDVQIGVGASLQLGASAQPLLVARFGFSDQGNSSNEVFSNLGDYRYTTDEPLGDIVLAAGASYGSGFVSVFGDTSPFQNSALPQTYSFVSHHFFYLASRTIDHTTLLQMVGVLGLLICLVVGLLLFHSSPRHLYLFSLILCAGLLTAQIVNTSLEPTLLPQNNLALIDVSQGEQITLDPFQETSINGLLLNLQRNGYLPLFVDQLSTDALNTASLIVFVAPTESFSTQQVHHLKAYMKTGGHLLLATGYPDKQSAEPLLTSMDLDLSNIPLGPVPYGAHEPEHYEFQPRFVDAWPITYSKNSIRSFHNFTWHDTYHLIVYAPYGSGGLVLIGDSQYLYNKNIESIYDYWPGNILLLKHLFEELQQRGGSP